MCLRRRLLSATCIATIWFGAAIADAPVAAQSPPEPRAVLECVTPTGVDQGVL